ncbi:hypothetical protein GFL93_09315 [Rhizobium leguminosarum bv. viciae]|uniref:hypothetical protein n=1 Tax=Rhizobium TaxID=379 RepID=UPI001440E7D1|nr:hypothetical protein [Rhizobium leguminosarum]NKK06069.1 hypothetical protein [Rhizobium leguminosarum bv. viciae]
MNDKQSLTLEAGKYYRTRDGRKAFVSATAPEGFSNPDTDGQFAGFIDGMGARMWGNDGGYLDFDQSDYDLMAEWGEPKRIKGWVNVYSGNDENYGNPHNIDSSQHCGHVYPKRAHADIAAVSLSGRNRIACIEIDVLEGAGLEGEVA